MRKCSVCKAEDKPWATLEACRCSGGQVLGHDADCDAVEHFVKPEVKFVKSDRDCTPRLEARGWKYILFQNRHAITRFTCVDCLRAQAEIDRQQAHYRKKAKALEQGDQLNYYQILCQ